VQKLHRLVITLKAANPADIKKAIGIVNSNGVEIRVDRDC
jgi:hypothetical protein